MTQFTAQLRGVNFRSVEAKARVNEFEGGEKLILMREPGNQFDPFAIMVMDEDTQMHLGYVAKGVAAELAPLMDEGKTFYCSVESVAFRSVLLQIEEETSDE